jgi:hypothetical protein
MPDRDKHHGGREMGELTHAGNPGSDARYMRKPKA